MNYHFLPRFSLFLAIFGNLTSLMTSSVSSTLHLRYIATSVMYIKSSAIPSNDLTFSYGLIKYPSEHFYQPPVWNFVTNSDNQFQNILRIRWDGQKNPLAPKINVETAFHCAKLTWNLIICIWVGNWRPTSPCQHWFWGEGGEKRVSAHFSQYFWNWLSGVEIDLVWEVVRKNQGKT